MGLGKEAESKIFLKLHALSMDRPVLKMCSYFIPMITVVKTENLED